MALRSALRGVRLGQQAVRLTQPTLTQLAQPASCRSINIWQLYGNRWRRFKEEFLANNELQRSYFEEFNEMKELKGKVFQTPTELVLPKKAKEFPAVKAMNVSGEEVPVVANVSKGSARPNHATLVSVLFRNHAQESLLKWMEHVSSHYADNKQGNMNLVQLSIVETGVFSWPGFKHGLYRGGKAVQAQLAGSEAAAGPTGAHLPLTVLFHFGNADEIRVRLRIANRLTGYLYLVDSHGKVRWEACGECSPKELEQMSACIDKLLEEDAI